MNGGNTHRSVRILIADDNAVNRDVVTGMLDILQCETAIARDGYEAIECCQQYAFDLVFMDCEMPGLDGYSATRAIRKLESKKASARVPIVALTANALYEAEEKCIEAGMDDYLSKPFSLNSLKEMVGKWARVEESSGGTDESGVSVLKNVAQAADRDKEKIPGGNLNAGVLDRNVLAGLKALQAQGSSDMFARVTKLYLDSSRELVEALQAACHTGEYEKIGQYAHALKSSSANVGAIRLSGYLAELEIKAREEMLEDVQERSAKIVREYGLVTSALSDEISR